MCLFKCICVVRRDSVGQRCGAVRYVGDPGANVGRFDKLSIILLNYNFKYFTLRLNTI